jgi:hypothetical protein
MTFPKFDGLSGLFRSGLFRSGLFRSGNEEPRHPARLDLRPGLLRITFFAGLPLLILSGGALLFFSLMGRGFQDPADDFHRLRRGYDRQYQAMVNDSAYPAGQHSAHGVDANSSVINAEKLSQELDRMEKKAGSVDTALSVLKRRRQLARLYPKYLPAFRQSAQRAAAAYPHSDSLAAMAAASLILDSAVTRETEAALRTALPLLSGPRFENLKLCLHVLLGDLQNPQKALANLPSGFSPALIPYSFNDRQALAADSAMIRLIGSGSSGGVYELADFSNDKLLSLSDAQRSGLSAQILHFAAEFFYDFGDPLQAARIFSNISADQALSRQADSLWLAGYPGSARNIWNVLTSSQEDNYRARALYNLALSAESPEEAAALLGRMVQLPKTGGPCAEAGLIHYSRFFDAPRAAAILEGGTGSVLIDLELLRRRSEIWETGRSIGAIWLLIDRYPEEENLYQWGAWFFDLQRAYSETSMLLTSGARRQFQETSSWMPLHRALLLLTEGNLNEAEQILLGLDSGGSDGRSSWEIQANLGRIYEAYLSPGRALEFYEKAAAGVQKKKDASRIQLRIAQCLITLGRPLESRRVLEYALDLNPDNLSARLELSRLEGR